VLLFGQTFFITIIPQIFGLVAGVLFSGINYPFSVVLFISIVPIILSVDHFLRVASQAAQDKAITESKVMGKVTSAVECRPAIRASNAGHWISSDMKDLFEQLRMATRNSWLRSDLARNFMVSFDCYLWYDDLLIHFVLTCLTLLSLHKGMGCNGNLFHSCVHSDLVDICNNCCIFYTSCALHTSSYILSLPS